MAVMSKEQKAQEEKREKRREEISAEILKAKAGKSEIKKIDKKGSSC
jgi:hypothetical protein